MKQLEKLAHAREGEKAECSPWKWSKDGLLRYEGKTYVPEDPALRAEITRANHDDPQGGHFGERRTLESVRRKYYWHGMARDIKKHVFSCDMCQRCAVHRHKEYGELEPLRHPALKSSYQDTAIIIAPIVRA